MVSHPYEIIPTISDIVSAEEPQKPMLNSEVESNQESFLKEDEEEENIVLLLMLYVVEIK